MRYLVTLWIAVLLAGCADTHQLVRSGNAPVKLDQSRSVYISVPRDGVYGQINYQGSGANTSQIILLVFSKYTENIETGHQHQSFDNALAYAKTNYYGYLVFPTILEWEDRATEWSALPDRISIKIAIIDAETGKTLDSATIKGKSGLATFGGDHPQDLLQEPIEEYVGTLY